MFPERNRSNWVKDNSVRPGFQNKDRTEDFSYFIPKFGNESRVELK